GGREPLDRPVGGAFAELGVDVVEMTRERAHHVFDQLGLVAREPLFLAAREPRRAESLAQQLGLVDDAERHLARAAPGALDRPRHDAPPAATRRRAIAIAASATSAPRFPIAPPVRASAWAAFSTASTP